MEKYIFKSLIKNGEILKCFNIIYKHFCRYLKSLFNNKFSYFVFNKFVLILLVYIILFWIYSEMEIYIKEYIAHNLNDKLLIVSKFIDKYDSVNTFIFLSICIAFYSLLIKIKNNLHYSISRLIVGLFLLYFFLFDNYWVYNKIPFINVGYNYLIALFVILLLSVDLLKKIIYLCDKVIINNSRKGKINFSNDQIDDPGEKSIRKNYARSIAVQLINTDITKVSFSLAITGEWGSGKSTFLKCIIDELTEDGKAYIIQFNPWNSISSQSLVQDFFKQLNEFVSNKYSPLEKSLISYANALKEVDIEPTINRFLKMIPMSDNQSIDKLKRNVEIGLSHIHKPVVIIIDDIDRLEKDELFEVLRLVRNTGNFVNLLYVVAYDEKYVIQQLNCKGIYNGRLFLEKIFPAQVSLPKVDLTEVYDTFKNEIRSMVKQSGWINSCIDTLNDEEIDLIKLALYSFRRAKHFARRFSMSAIFLYYNLGPRYFSLHDLLLVELLHYLSPSLYDILTNDPKRFLISKNDNIIGRYYYVIDQSKESDLKTFLKSENENSKDVIMKIFELLFSAAISIPEGGVRWTDKYVNYMCLGRPKNKVSDLEFFTMLNSQIGRNNPNNSMLVIIKSWCSSRHNRKDIRSIYDQFAKFRPERNSYDVCVKYINALFYWLKCECDSENNLLYCMVSNGMMKNRYSSKLWDGLHNIILDNIQNMIIDHNFVKFTKLARYLYENSEENVYFINDNEIVKYMIDNIAAVLNIKSWNAIDLVLDNGNLLNEVFKMSTMSKYTKNKDSSCMNPTANYVINWFANKPKLSDSIDIVNDMFYKDEEFNNSKYLISLFGTDNPHMYLNNYKNRCFKSNVAVAPKHIINRR